jgi:hypothetical protein
MMAQGGGEVTDNRYLPDVKAVKFSNVNQNELAIIRLG